MIHTSQNRLRDLVSIALMAAVLAVISPLSVAVGPLPFSLGTLGIYLSAAILGAKRGTTAVGLYLLIGLIGVPVFAGFAGGVPHLIGPTGGFLMGYLPCTALSGLLISRFGDRRPAVWVGALLLGTLLLYLSGSVWYAATGGIEWIAALPVCVLPFLPGDAVKIAVAVAAGYPLKNLLSRHHLLP